MTPRTKTILWAGAALACLILSIFALRALLTYDPAADLPRDQPIPRRQLGAGGDPHGLGRPPGPEQHQRLYRRPEDPPADLRSAG